MLDSIVCSGFCIFPSRTEPQWSSTNWQAAHVQIIDRYGLSFCFPLSLNCVIYSLTVFGVWIVEWGGYSALETLHRRSDFLNL